MKEEKLVLLHKLFQAIETYDIWIVQWLKWINAPTDSGAICLQISTTIYKWASRESEKEKVLYDEGVHNQAWPLIDLARSYLEDLKFWATELVLRVTSWWLMVCFHFFKFDSIVTNYNDKGRSELLTFSLEIPKDGNWTCKAFESWYNYRNWQLTLKPSSITSGLKEI